MKMVKPVNYLDTGKKLKSAPFRWLDPVRKTDLCNSEYPLLLPRARV